MSENRLVLGAVEAELGRYKAIAEGVFAQLTDEQLLQRASSESNSIAMLVWHMAGNLESRFTDFLTTDGEKPWRGRESEFEARVPSRTEMLAKWERGWSFLYGAVAELKEEDLARTVHIRGEANTVSEALQRALAHASYHVGQMTFWGKVLRGSAWTYLTIPPGGSTAYEAGRAKERGPA